MSHWRRVLFWGLLPWVIPQALYVRRSAPRFAPASGPRVGWVGQGEPLRLLAIGDSIVAGVGVERTDEALASRTAARLASELDRAVMWQAVGQSGATAVTVRERLLPRAPDEAFDVIVVSVGVNDVTSLNRTGRWQHNLSALLAALRRRFPAAPIILAGLPPLWGFPLLPQPLRALFGMRARTFDEVASRVAAASEGVAHVPLDFDPTPEKFSPDGYHPSVESYGVFGGLMAHAAARLLQRSSD